MKINFNLRNKKKNPTRIILIVRWMGYTLKLPSLIEIDPDKWDTATQRIKTSLSDPNTYHQNKALDRMRDEVHAKFLKFTERERREPEPYELRNELSKRPVSSEFFTYVQDWIDAAPNRISRTTGERTNYRTIQKYCTVFNRLKTYQKHLGRAITFNSLDARFVEGFTSWMESQGLKPNTIGKDIEIVRRWLREAHIDKAHDNRSFMGQGWQVTRRRVSHIYLSVDELRQMEDAQLEREALRNVRDLFIVACWTGFRYSDLERAGEILSGLKGDVINTIQFKTGRSVSIPVLPPVRRMLDRYGGVLPDVVSNQKFNKHLKDVARESGICTLVDVTSGRKVERVEKWRLVTTHTARRSYCTNLFLLGIKPIEIMKVSGHATESEFMRYISVSAEVSAKSISDRLDGVI